MLTVLGYSMVVVFMALIMTKRLPAVVALILVPIVFGLLGGFGAGLGPMMHLLSPLVASTYLLVGMAEVEFGDHQRYTLFWSLTASLVMLVAAIVFGVIPLIGHLR
jgi:Mg2+/citrate symporter